MIKEILIALILGMAFMYEIWVITNMKKFVNLAYTPIEKKTRDEKVKIFAISIFNFVYFVFVVLGLAFGSQWEMYAILFGLSVVSSPIIRYYKNKENLVAITMIRYADTIISICVIVQVFLNHFHS